MLVGGLTQMEVQLEVGNIQG